MTLSRIIRATHNESLSLLPIRWQTRLFVWGDVLAFLTQMLGGGLQAAGTLAFLHAGEKIILAGLLVQIMFFGLFITTSTVFHSRCRKHLMDDGLDQGLPWEKMMLMLYSVSLLIMVRSIFRVVEYVQGNAGYLLRREWPLYVFDALLMVTTMVIFLVFSTKSVGSCTMLKTSPKCRAYNHREQDIRVSDNGDLLSMEDRHNIRVRIQ